MNMSGISKIIGKEKIFGHTRKVAERDRDVI
jgi:hypothetical protein